MGIGKRSKSSGSYSVAPNPSSHFITIVGLVDSPISIYSSNGELVLSANYLAESELDISALQSGLYVVRCEKNNDTQKFIVVK